MLDKMEKRAAKKKEKAAMARTQGCMSSNMGSTTGRSLHNHLENIRNDINRQERIDKGDTISAKIS